MPLLEDDQAVPQQRLERRVDRLLGSLHAADKLALGDRAAAVAQGIENPERILGEIEGARRVAIQLVVFENDAVKRAHGFGCVQHGVASYVRNRTNAIIVRFRMNIK